MSVYPGRCPSCNQPNTAHLHYCAVCGMRFTPVKPQSSGKSPSKKGVSNEQKLKVKKLKKKKELIELYKRKKITNEQFAKGMAKLGFSTDIEKAMEFKKYIQAQIQAFENMDVSGADEGGYHFDPNESKAQLPRDEHGNVITDFSVAPTAARSRSVHEETYAQPVMTASRPPPSTTSTGGPLFGENLFGGERTSRGKVERKEVPKATLKRDIPSRHSRKHPSRRKRGDLEWDEDEEEEQAEEEEFEIDLEDEEVMGESGWWDDEEWELEWSEEDEEEWEDWDLEEEEEDEWEMWEDELQQPSGVTVEFEDDDEEDQEEEEVDDDVFDPRTYYDEEDGDEEDEEEDHEEEEDDWEEPRRRRRRR